MAFRTQSMATPESANTAIHILAKPSSPRIMTTNFTPRAKITFCQAMDRVARAMAMASGMASGSERSFIPCF